MVYGAYASLAWCVARAPLAQCVALVLRWQDVSRVGPDGDPSGTWPPSRVAWDILLTGGEAYAGMRWVNDTSAAVVWRGLPPGKEPDGAAHTRVGEAAV